MLCRRHQPGARLLGNARLRPLFQCRNQSILREFLGQSDIAHHPRQPGDDLRGLNPPDCFDCAMGIGRCHQYPSHHLQFLCASLELSVCGVPRNESCVLLATTSMPVEAYLPVRTSDEPRSPPPSPANVSCEVPGSAPSNQWPLSLTSIQTSHTR